VRVKILKGVKVGYADGTEDIKNGISIRKKRIKQLGKMSGRGDVDNFGIVDVHWEDKSWV